MKDFANVLMIMLAFVGALVFFGIAAFTPGIEGVRYGVLSLICLFYVLILLVLSRG